MGYDGPNDYEAEKTIVKGEAKLARAEQREESK